MGNSKSLTIYLICILAAGLSFVSAVNAQPSVATPASKAPVPQPPELYPLGIRLTEIGPYTMYQLTLYNTDLGITDKFLQKHIKNISVNCTEGNLVYPVIVDDYDHKAASEDKEYRSRVSMIALQRGKRRAQFTITNSENDLHLSFDIPSDMPLSDDAPKDKLLDAWAARLGYVWSSQNTLANYIRAMVLRSAEDQLGAKQLYHYGSHRSSEQLEFIETLTGSRGLQLAMQTDILLRRTKAGEVADLPLPADPRISLVNLPKAYSTVQIENMANCIPHECFYIYMPSWDDFQWLLDNMEDFDSSGRPLALEPIDYTPRAKIEGQLAIRQTVMSELFGDKIIKSVAMIGTDTFLRAGSSVGLVFEAKNNFLLKKHLNKLRQEAMDNAAQASEVEETIEGQTVSLLSTSDNRIRSFYVQKDDFHLVTNSRYIAGRFLKAAGGTDNLAASDEYKWARAVMPLDRNDTAFAFLSDAFIRKLISSQYRVEMTRRNYSLTRINMARMAKAAAKAEGRNLSSIGELIEHDYLPEDFNTAPDASTIYTAADGDFVCSLRGAAGSFLPVSDVKIHNITYSENEALKRFISSYGRIWQNIDPAIIAFKRSENSNGDDHISIDIMQTPYPIQTYQEFARFLSRPNSIKIIGDNSDDLISAEVSISTAEIMNQIGGGLLGGNNPFSQMMIHKIFAGLRDFEPPAEVLNRTPEQIKNLFHDDITKSANFYVGESPMPQLLLMMVAGRQSDTDADGYYQFDDYCGRSFGNIHIAGNTRQTLEAASESLKTHKADTPAQVRLKISRLDNKKITPLLRSVLYLAARNSTRKNAHTLTSFKQLLNLNAGQAQKMAEIILGGDMFCPLGGEYIDAVNNSVTSSDYDTNPTSALPPESFNTRLLDSFRGLKMNFNIDAEQQLLHVHTEFDMAPR